MMFAAQCLHRYAGSAGVTFQQDYISQICDFSNFPAGKATFLN